MKKILVLMILFSLFIFSDEIDLLQQMSDSKNKENVTNFFFDAIRKKNNALVINILDIVAEIRALLGTICRNYGRTLTGTENTEIEVIVNQLYAEKGITSDVNSLFEKKGGKLDNGKYAIGRIPKKMPTLTDFQKKLKERGNCEELSNILVPFLKGNSLRYV